jgi:hypothetical protein
MTDDDRISELEALLREEREFRQAAESRVQSLTERAEVWRERAEERAERIARLTAASELPGLRRWASRIRRSVLTSASRDEPGVAPSRRHTPMCLPIYPAVRIAAAVTTDGIGACLSTADVVDLATASNPYSDADVVVMQPAAFRTLSDGARAGFVEWAKLDGRQPLVVWASGDAVDHDLVALLRDSDVVAATRGKNLHAVGRHAKRRVHHLPETLDPVLHTPATRSQQASTVIIGATEGAFVEVVSDVRTAVIAPTGLLDDPPGWLIELAALGVPLVIGDVPETAVPDSASAAAVRWAYRHHAPWVRLAEMLRLAGTDVPDPTPTVGALLVSRRPGEVPGAVARMAIQSYRPVELVVGLHGVKSTPHIQAAIAACELQVTLLELDGDLSLGECLNRAAGATSASVLAKIDDDDHYGPAYLEDGVHALRHSGAGVVVKAAQFTYLAARDETVLRRARQEHVFLDGSTAGATFLIQRSLWEAVRFPHRTRGEDLRFLRGVRAVGGSVYAGSRWEFCYVRKAGHTWTAADETFLAGSIHAWDGFQPSRVEVPDLVTTV